MEYCIYRHINVRLEPCFSTRVNLPPGDTGPVLETVFGGVGATNRTSRGPNAPKHHMHRDIPHNGTYPAQESVMPRLRNLD